jgi:hypothetical protein
MADLPSLHNAGLLEVLSAYQSDYKDAVEHWRSLETKAQASITMAGIFLAAGFALVRELDPTTTWWVRGLLLIGALALMVAVVFAVLALKVRVVPAPPSAETLNRIVNDFFRAPGPTNLEQETRNQLHDRIRTWQGCVRDRVQLNRSKAQNVLRAQLALLTTVTVVALLTGGAILSPGEFGNPALEKETDNAMQGSRLPRKCD